MDWIRKRLRLSARGWLPFWVILPALLVIAAIQLYPTIYTVILSLQQIEPGTGQFIFVGARNFERLFGSIAFMRSLVHTVVFLSLIHI